MTILTALEIFTNPDDLEFSIGLEGNKWAVIISRGPGHYFKLLLSSEHVFGSREAAIDKIKGELVFICEKGKEILGDSSNPAANVINPDNLPVGNMEVLTQERLEQIINELRANGMASTYKMAASR